MLKAPGAVIREYPRSDALASGPPPIPKTFNDALVVRKVVFVHEQGCSLAPEVDDDDEKSYHWVVYASIGEPKNKPTTPASEYEARRSQGGELPIGTVRLVPAPHAKHPLPGSIDGHGGEPYAYPSEKLDRATKFHDGEEVYLKIGRMATAKEFRRYKLGTLLLDNVLNYVRNNPKEFSLWPKDQHEVERAIVSCGGKPDKLDWKGLVLAHSQKSAVGFYEKFGFAVDEELGTWIEEGIEHVAMWKRLELSARK